MWSETLQELPQQDISLYQVLGVSILASTEEIKQAWKKQALLTHPDRHQTNQSEAKQRFLDIQHAYDVLKDSMLRAEYDKELLHRLYLEEYLRRFADLILTASGLGLPLENDNTPLFFLEDAIKDVVTTSTVVVGQA